MKILFAISVLFVLASCGRLTVPQQVIKTVTRDSVVTNTVYLPKDSIIYLPGDTLEIYEAIPCPEVDLSREVRSTKTSMTASVKIKNGQLSVECKTDSLMERIAWLEKQVEKASFSVKETTIEVPVEVIKNKVPKWCWWLLLAVVVYIDIRILIFKYNLPIKL